jgi:hypothetical protein
MLAQLAIGVDEAAIVPPEHDTGSASNAREQGDTRQH